MRAACENCRRFLPRHHLTRKFLFATRAFCSGKCAAEFDARHEDTFAWVTLEHLDIFATKPAAPRAVHRKEVEAGAAA